MTVKVLCPTWRPGTKSLGVGWQPEVTKVTQGQGQGHSRVVPRLKAYGE